MEHLVRVNVPDAGHGLLVEEQALQPSLPVFEDPGKSGKMKIQRLRAELADFPEVREIVRPDAFYETKFSDVAEAEFVGPVLEAENETGVFIAGPARRPEDELPGHLEVDKQGQPGVARHEDHLAAAAEPQDFPAGECSPQFGIRPARGLGANQKVRGDGPAFEPRRQASDHGFDFRELGHASILLERILICPPFSVKIFSP
jgi:hypothetical protein